MKVQTINEAMSKGSPYFPILRVVSDITKMSKELEKLIEGADKGDISDSDIEDMVDDMEELIKKLMKEANKLD